MQKQTPFTFFKTCGTGRRACHRTVTSNVNIEEGSFGAIIVDIMERVFEKEGDFVIEDGVLVAYQGSGGDVVIPDGVVSIGGQAFQYGTLKSVTVPDSVTFCGLTHG